MAPSFVLGSNLNDYALIAGSAITCTGSTITGDVGVSPGTAFTNTGCVVAGTVRTTAEAAVAKAELNTAYNNLTQTCTPIDGNLNGVTLQPGTYCVAAAAVNLNDTLTLSGNGLFLLRFASTFITGSNSRVLLTNGATCGGVAYQVGSSATLAGNLTGNVLAQTAITGNPGSVTNGRLLTQDAAVTLSTSTVTMTGCNNN